MVFIRVAFFDQLRVCTRCFVWDRFDAYVRVESVPFCFLQRNIGLFCFAPLPPGAFFFFPVAAVGPSLRAGCSKCYAMLLRRVPPEKKGRGIRAAREGEWEGNRFLPVRVARARTLDKKIRVVPCPCPTVCEGPCGATVFPMHAYVRVVHSIQGLCGCKCTGRLGVHTHVGRNARVRTRGSCKCICWYPGTMGNGGYE